MNKLHFSKFWVIKRNIDTHWKKQALGTGHGRNKKAAEQMAAGQALEKSK